MTWRHERAVLIHMISRFRAASGTLRNARRHKAPSEVIEFYLGAKTEAWNSLQSMRELLERL